MRPSSRSLSHECWCAAVDSVESSAVVRELVLDRMASGAFTKFHLQISVVLLKNAVGLGGY